MTAKKSRTRRPLSKAHQTIAEHLYEERTRPRPGRPNGIQISEIPKSIAGPSTIDRLESGTQPKVNPSTVTDLMLRVYGSSHETILTVAELAEATLEPNWFDAYRPRVAKQAWLYQYQEERAAHIRWHSSLYVPALAQCREYVDALWANLRKQQAHPEPTDLSATYELRLERSERWLESDRKLTAVVGEPALQLNLGPGIADAQVQHLLKLDSLPHVEIYVAPLSAGRYPVLGFEYAMLDFDDDPAPLICNFGESVTYVNPDSELGVFYRTGFTEGTKKAMRMTEYASHA